MKSERVTCPACNTSCEIMHTSAGYWASCTTCHIPGNLRQTVEDARHEFQREVQLRLRDRAEGKA